MASYLEVEGLSKSYGERMLFSNISFNINEGDKIALVAPNGTGKSSLLRIIAGEDGSDGEGRVRFLREIRVAFLEQEQHYGSDEKIFDIVFRGGGEKVRIISEYEAAVASGEREALESAAAAMDASDCWNYEHEIEELISVLKIPEMNRTAGTLSGGECKRVALAAMLVSRPDFLVMDEPTNHLDLESIEWLENYLSRSKCTLLMVTHDRYFLDRVCNTIIELSEGSLYTYNGNYSYFLEKREERIENLNAATQRTRNLMRGELEWIRRTPCARGTKAKYRVNAFEELKARASRHITEQNVEIRAAMSRLGEKILDCRHLSYRSDGFVGVDDFSYNFAPGEKIGIVGPNGVGKSTFLNLLTGSLQPTSGEIDCGTTVKFGYYRQEGIEFQKGQTVIEYVQEIADNITMDDGRVVSATSFLTRFLFPPAAQYSKIEKLSGGEKRRLYLLGILIGAPNVLILDEPTNDLDILTLNVLEEYLQEFGGSVIIVSHDRFFLDKITDHLFIFKGEGKIKDYPGSYSDYRAAMAMAAEEETSLSSGGSMVKERQKEKVKTKSLPSVRRLTYKEQKEMEQIEADLAGLEREKGILEEKLSSGSLSPAELEEASRRIGIVLEEIDEKELRWLELSD